MRSFSCANSKSPSIPSLFQTLFCLYGTYRGQKAHKCSKTLFIAIGAPSLTSHAGKHKLSQDVVQWTILKDPKPPSGTRLNGMKHPPEIKTFGCLGICSVNNHFSHSYPQMDIPTSVELHLDCSYRISPQQRGLLSMGRRATAPVRFVPGLQTEPRTEGSGALALPHCSSQLEQAASSKS